MRKITRIILAGLGLSLVTFVFAFFSSRPTSAQLTPPVVPVKVTNTPLPVQGTVTANINSLPNVNATITNSSLSALITNPANNPVLVSKVSDTADREFFFSLCEADYSFPADCPAGFNQFRQEFISVFTVPTSTPSGLTVTRAVIEYTSGLCRADTTDDIAEVGIEGTFTNNFSFFAPVRTPGAQRLVVPVPGQNSPTTWTWSHTTKIYLPPGASINLLVKSTGIPNQINLQECGGSFWGTLLTQ
jgi:hypothetical protein